MKENKKCKCICNSCGEKKILQFSKRILHLLNWHKLQLLVYYLFIQSSCQIVLTLCLSTCALLGYHFKDISLSGFSMSSTKTDLLMYYLHWKSWDIFRFVSAFKIVHVEQFSKIKHHHKKCFVIFHIMSQAVQPMLSCIAQSAENVS